MSLYGGIKFSAPPGEPPPPPPDAESTSTSAAPSAVPPHVSDTGSSNAASSADPTATKPPLSAKATGEYSAALKFAPRIKQAKAAAPSRPIASSSTTYSAPPVMIEARATTMRSAEPVSNTFQKEDEVLLGPDGKTLAKAPAMTLAAAGQKEWTAGDAKGAQKRERSGAGDGSKKKKKKKKKTQQPLMPTFDPEEQYDPNRPNDLGEYQQYRKRLREEKRAKLVEEKRRKVAGLGSSDEGSSYYTDSEEEAVPRRDAPRMWAPPKAYAVPPSARLFQPPNDPSPASPATSHPATGEDAYARRLALSQAATGDDAYAKRAALWQAGASTGTTARSSNIPQPASFFAPPAAPPNFTAPTPYLPVGAPPPPRPEPAISDIPGFGSYSAPPPSVLGSLTVQPPTVQPGLVPVIDLNELEKRKQAAAAIAAKLQAFAASAGGPPPPLGVAPAAPQDEVSGSFAEKMFKKWGHTGGGLGKSGEGIVHALAAEHFLAPPKSGDPSQAQSKRQIAKQKAAAANAKNRKWVQNATNRGRIVNANEDERQREEKEKIGEASRVICLTGLVDGLDDVDEELSDEIGEECSKVGIVERVLLHMVEPPPLEPSDCLRVFVVFSGLAGAWRATKELDGRFFGGKKIRAKYYDEAKFDSGRRDDPLPAS